MKWIYGVSIRKEQRGFCEIWRARRPASSVNVGDGERPPAAARRKRQQNAGQCLMRANARTRHKFRAQRKIF